MLIALAYRLGRRALGVLGTVARSDGALMAEVLALRHENAVLRRQVARVRGQKKVELEHYLGATAINFIGLGAYFTHQPLDRAHSSRLIRLQAATTN